MDCLYVWHGYISCQWTSQVRSGACDVFRITLRGHVTWNQVFVFMFILVQRRHRKRFVFVTYMEPCKSWIGYSELWEFYFWVTGWLISFLAMWLVKGRSSQWEFDDYANNANRIRLSKFESLINSPSKEQHMSQKDLLFWPTYLCDSSHCH